MSASVPPSRQPVALVTGAAGGVGTDVVRQFAARGFAVVAEDRSPAVGALAEISPDVIPLRADVAAPGAAEAAIEHALHRCGRLDVLVNNAAVFLRKPLAECTIEDWDRLMAVNARAPFLHSKAAIPALGDSHGAIVNVCSISGLVGLVDQSIYGATKGALVQLTRQMAIEHAAAGIRVNAVAPGAIDDDFTAEANRHLPDPDAWKPVSIARHPLHRLTTTAEVAEAIVFLATAQAITGAILSVDGGYVAG